MPGTFHLDKGKILSQTSQRLTNHSDSPQRTSFEVNKGVTNSSMFEYSTGSTFKVDGEFKGRLHSAYRPRCGVKL